MRHVELLAEDSALGVDLVDRHSDAVAPIGAGHRAGPGQFDDIGNVNGRLRRCGERGEQKSAPKNSGDRQLHAFLPAKSRTASLC
jgi:hypothetical protein